MSQHPFSNSSLETILGLASTINECATVLSETSNNNEVSKHQKPRHSTPISPPRSPKPAEKSLVSTRSKLQEACDELLHVVNGPQENIMAIAQSHRIEAALQYASHFRLATFVPVEEGSSITFTALAVKAGVPAKQCARILRLLMTCYIFHEPEDGAVAHTPDSKLLLNEHIEAMVGYWTDESFLAAAYFSSAAEKWPESQERNDTALNMAFNTRLPKFDFFDSEPWRAKRFRKAMAGMTQGDRFSLEHLVKGYKWASLPDGATVVDIGGGGGHCSMAIAAANSGLRFIVQDLKSAFDTAAVPPALKDRIQFMEHDFFTLQPSIGDIYFLRWILHDYPDKFACDILRAQLSAMRPGTKLIVMEGIMRPPGTQGKLDERKSRILDIAMMSLLNSSERDLNGWLSLFQEADRRLRLLNVVQPPGSALSIMELELATTDCSTT